MWLGDARKATGLTNARLGARIGYHGTAVSRACNGKTVPSWALASAIVVACRADVGLARRLWEAADKQQRMHRNLRVRREPSGQISTFDDLSDALREMWLDTGLSQRAIVDAAESGWLRRSNLGAVLRGERRPRRGMTEALVRACGGNEQSVDMWAQAWDRLNEVEAERRRARAFAVREQRRRYFRRAQAARRPYAGRRDDR
ncbi:helix-turn-helix transcriptional regulator [Lentzea sp. BCCO 10_0061]|uniref:Helix-turn-helix transcriptional regulator n=1 Tax=Lentzea sokolovensis TaxID=3095429 RepID=A0ABU4UYP9_9PSEU|nr:helix-turn-helix transcriptional regulator [Lentzea sp. BCCO 10_0061]MDX8144094.1 helix-turn-helix transcriptional regulator [Lentzea sp. BCCO 10_0061]